MKNTRNNLNFRDNTFLKFKQKATKLFHKRYEICSQYYGVTIINNIIYNEKAHIVALFKDCLIQDDCSEFLKRFYRIDESGKRLPRFFDYYETYSKIFPNYTSIIEGKYIYYNIQRKQRIINIQEEMEIEAKFQEDKTSRTDEVFSTDIYDSIINDRNNEDLEQIFNLNDKSYEETDKLNDLINELERNDNYNSNNLNNSGNNIQMQPTLRNSVTTKKKLMITSLLGRNQKAYNNNNTISIRNNNDTQKWYYHNNNSSTINNSINNNIPLTDRPCSNNKSNAIIRPPQSRQLSKSKMMSEFPNTVCIDNYGNLNSNQIKGKRGIPLTYRQHNNKENGDHILTKQNERERDKSEKLTIKTPPNGNSNIIYILSKNPKLMTNVTIYNNPTIKHTSTRNLTMMQAHHVKALSNIQTQLIAKKQITTSKGKTIDPYFLDDKTSRTRNNGNKGNPSVSKEYLLKTAKESTNNDQLNLLRTSSQIIKPNKGKENIYSTKYQLRTNSIHSNSSSRTKIRPNRQSKKIKTLTLRNDSLTRKTSANISNNVTIASKKEVKGIHIKHFNKVLGFNFALANSNRNEKKGF